MAPEQMRALWAKYDDLIARATDEQTKLILEAMKLNAELLNGRLAPVENLLGIISRR